LKRHFIDTLSSKEQIKFTLNKKRSAANESTIKKSPQEFKKIVVERNKKIPIIKKKAKVDI
jgi:hypothetical protein